MSLVERKRVLVNSCTAPPAPEQTYKKLKVEHQCVLAPSILEQSASPASVLLRSQHATAANPSDASGHQISSPKLIDPCSCVPLLGAPPQQVAHRVVLPSTTEDVLPSTTEDDILMSDGVRAGAKVAGTVSASGETKADGEAADPFTCDWETHCSQVFGAMWIDEEKTVEKAEPAQHNNIHNYFKRR
jgi:hypothetical protein